MLQIIVYPLVHIKAYAAPALSINPSLGISNITQGQGGQVFNTNPASIDHIIAVILTVIFSIAGLVAFALIVYSGFIYMTSGGDQSMLEKSRKALMNAVIGLIIVILAYFLTHFLLGLFGIDAGGSFTNIFNAL